MWTLVLITIAMIVSHPGGGDVATSTSFLDFPDEAKCRAAAAAVGDSDATFPGGGYTSPSRYRIIAKCVQR